MQQREAVELETLVLWAEILPLGAVAQPFKCALGVFRTER